jgi:hypothetical protein
VSQTAVIPQAIYRVSQTAVTPQAIYRVSQTELCSEFTNKENVQVK